jgi:hypothetical protein
MMRAKPSGRYLLRASIEVERYCITDDGPKALKE